MIEFKNIFKSFNGKVVLDGISHVMETGKIILTGTGEELANSDEVRKAYLVG